MQDRALALALSTRIAVLVEGRVVQEGKPEEIYWRPRTRFVAEWVGAANLVPVRVIELRDMGVVVETAGGARLPVASGGHAWTVGAPGLLCLRPEALRIEESALAPGGIPGTVTAQVFEGSRQIYEVDIAGGTLRVEMITSALLARRLQARRSGQGRGLDGHLRPPARRRAQRALTRRIPTMVWWRAREEETDA